MRHTRKSKAETMIVNPKQQRTERQRFEVMLDALWREYIRRRAIRGAKGCQYKLKCNIPVRSYLGLEAAHLHGRGRRTVRWDPRNGVGVCHYCHRYLDTHPKEKHRFFKELLGEKEYWRLFQLANMTTKSAPVDYEKIEANLRERLLNEG